MTDDAKTPNADEEPTAAIETPTDDEQPTAAAETPVPAPTASSAKPRGLDKRTAGVTLVGVSALLIAFFGGYAIGEQRSDHDRGERIGMRGPGGGAFGDGNGPSLRRDGEQGGRGGGMPALPGGPRGDGAGGSLGELRRERLGVIGAITKIDGDEVTIKPVRGSETITADVDDVHALGHLRDDTEDATDDDELEVGDIVAVRTDTEDDAEAS